MLDLTNVVRSRQHFAVYLRKKACLNENKSARRKVVYVRANDKAEAKTVALSMPENAAFMLDGQPREIR